MKALVLLSILTVLTLGLCSCGSGPSGHATSDDQWGPAAYSKMAVTPAPTDAQVRSIISPVIVDALQGDRPKTDLPYWFGYPWKNVTQATEWTNAVLKDIDDLGPKLVASNPTDMSLFCPNFENLGVSGRHAVWTKLVSIIVEMESTFDPADVYQDKEVGPNVLSEGLMQLSLEDRLTFGCGEIHSEADLLNGELNLSCSIRIMNLYIGRDNLVVGYSGTADSGKWLGLAAYWGSMRDSRLKTAEGRAALADLVKQKREAWLKEGDRLRHAALLDEQHRNEGEKNLEKVLRLMNQTGLCRLGEAPDQSPVQ